MENKSYLSKKLQELTSKYPGFVATLLVFTIFSIFFAIVIALSVILVKILPFILLGILAVIAIKIVKKKFE